MKVAVAASQASLDAPVDPRFGRCPLFLVVDTETMEFEALENQAAMAGGGAGIQAAQMVANAGAQAVMAGNFGPNAFYAFSQAGIAMYPVPPGMSVRQAIEALNNGELQPLSGPSVSAHWGMGAGMGRGMGRGMGGGRFMGPGMGPVGPGAGPAAWGAWPVGPMPAPGPMPPSAPPASPATLEALKAQLDALQQQVEELRKLIEQQSEE